MAQRVSRMNRLPGIFLSLLLLSACDGGAGLQENGDRDRNSLKVICYNVRVGAGPHPERLTGAGLRENLAALVEFLRKHDPDVVLLQEIDQGTRRSGDTMQAELLAAELGYFHYFAKAMDYDGGAYGTAMLSRWPLRETQTIRLYHEGGTEQRTLSAAVLQSPGGAILLLNTHLGLTPAQRARQTAEIAAFVEKNLRRMPIVLAGDFNATPEADEMRPIYALLRDAGAPDNRLVPPGDRSTSPALSPSRTIDYIFVSPEIQVLETRVIQVLLSDHLPIIATLTVGG
jgi:endonuclease/exonuclease/phosphatase family metal-dependent hydrolase